MGKIVAETRLFGKPSHQEEHGGHDTSEAEDQAERVARREKKAEGRVEKLRAEIRAILTACGQPMTRKEIWEALPDAMRVNEKVFREVLEDDEEGWVQEGVRGGGGGFQYRMGRED